MSKKADRGSRPPKGSDSREARLAEALRANLRRRKAAARPVSPAADQEGGSEGDKQG